MQDIEVSKALKSQKSSQKSAQKMRSKSAGWLRSVDAGHETSKLCQHNHHNINFICTLTVKNMYVEYLPRSAALLGVSRGQS